MKRTKVDALNRLSVAVCGESCGQKCICDALNSICQRAFGTPSTATRIVDAIDNVAEAIEKNGGVGGAQNVVFADGITTMNTTLEGFAAHIVEIVVPEGVTTLEQSENGEGGTARFQMFPNLRKLTLPGSLGTVPNLGASDTNLWDCLKELVLTEGFTTIGFAQFEYYSLEKIEIPSTMVEIGERAFDGNCMKTIIIHKPENSIAGAPWGATNATVIWTG